MTDWKWIWKNKILRESDWKWIWHYKILRERKPPPGPPQEPEVMAAVKNIWGEVFVDIGANLGYYSMWLAENFKQVYAVEPDKQVVKKFLAKNTRGIENVKILPYAMSDSDGSEKLFLVSNTMMSSIRPQGRFPKRVKVRTQRFDSFFLNREVELVKMDVEGAEFKVLEGMSWSLKERKVRNIVVELHHKERLGELLHLLQEYGFATEVLDSHPHVLGWLN